VTAFVVLILVSSITPTYHPAKHIIGQRPLNICWRNDLASAFWSQKCAFHILSFHEWCIIWWPFEFPFNHATKLNSDLLLWPRTAYIPFPSILSWLYGHEFYTKCVLLYKQPPWNFLAADDVIYSHYFNAIYMLMTFKFYFWLSLWLTYPTFDFPPQTCSTHTLSSLRKENHQPPNFWGHKSSLSSVALFPSPLIFNPSINKTCHPLPSFTATITNHLKLGALESVLEPCGRQNNVPLKKKNVYVIILVPGNMSPYMDKDPYWGEGSDYPGLSGGPNLITSILTKGRQKRESEKIWRQKPRRVIRP
jgi:hypothetical protein